MTGHADVIRHALRLTHPYGQERKDAVAELDALLAENAALQTRAEQAESENTTLRGLAALEKPCHYCGAETMAKCPRGFPGCALADDILIAVDAESVRRSDRLAAAEAELAGIRQALSEVAHLVHTRSTGIHMDGSKQWPTPLHGQIYDIARAALAVSSPPSEVYGIGEVEGGP